MSEKLEKQNELNQITNESNSNLTDNNSSNNNAKLKTNIANIQNLNATKIPNTKHISRSQTRKSIISPKRQQSKNFNALNSINKISANKSNYNSSPTKKHNDEEIVILFYNYLK